MIIEKKQKDISHCRFNAYYFPSARAGFKKVLRNCLPHKKVLLLPAYVGVSDREGSGVFDPVKELGAAYIFYRLTSRLNIDMEDIERKIRSHPSSVLLLIHYFGFKDKNIHRVRKCARKYGCCLIEDYAHAFFTFYAGCDADFDYGVFSLHKMFPLKSGGLVLTRDKLDGKKRGGLDLFTFDINAIAQRRIANYRCLLSEFRRQIPSQDTVILRKTLDGAVPQTFPILLADSATRDHLYFQMNRKGYGVVSLYHRLIDEINGAFTREHRISERILNLPVHQDADEKSIKRMVSQLAVLMKNYKGARQAGAF